MAYIPDRNLNESSLLQMLDFFIKKTENPLSGFYYNNEKKMIKIIQNYDYAQSKKIIIWGLSYTLLDLIPKFPNPQIPHFSIIETGGMKGKRKEIVKDEFYSIILAKLGNVQIYSEYGMTELTSQFYALKNGYFFEMPWAKIRLRDITDPFESAKRYYGGINVIDLANFHSCAFIEVKDLGEKKPDNTFRITGRYDNSELRGCNMLI